MSRHHLQLLGIAAVLIAMTGTCLDAAETPRYTPPTTPRMRYCLDADWKFIRQDVPGAEKPAYDDREWKTVGLPHTVNEEDAFQHRASNGGDMAVWQGLMWYRKHFRIPRQADGGKVLLEVEGLRQAGRFFLNGAELGLYENGITPYGLDLTPHIRGGGEDNVLAVQVDNDFRYREKSSGSLFQWYGLGFYPMYGGLNRNLFLHLAGTIYQTLPLYRDLGTTGVYVHARNHDIPGASAEIVVESQVRNEAGAAQRIQLEVHVVDAAGVEAACFRNEAQELAAGATVVLTAAGKLTNARFWDEWQPNLYTVHSLLIAQGRPIDACAITTGFRKTAFKGGAGTGGVHLNDHLVLLKGYAQRSTSEWAGLGTAYPDWLHDFTARCLVDSRGNHIRWMHVAPKRADVTACDRAGIIQSTPVADAEKDVTGRMWEQRVEAMRDALIYFRNHPSIVMWEAGNDGISAEHMKEMHDLRLRWDPHGGRAMGCRSLLPPAYPYAEYLSIMGARFTDEARDHMPVIEAEQMRDEAARRFWDDQSPPHFGFKQVKGNGDRESDKYPWNSETFCLTAAKMFLMYTTQSIANPDPKDSRFAGYASIIFTDSNSHGRQVMSEACRVSGKMDAVRLPKEIWYTHRVMQNPVPDIHIIGHWTYPAKTRKTMYVAANCDSVELLVNGRSLGRNAAPKNRIIFEFPDVAWEPGRIQALGFIKGRKVCDHELVTAGPAAALRLTPMTAPGGWRADGSDVALIDVEAVDAQGRRCPTDEARVDFAVEGPCIWRGGYNSGKLDSVNKPYLDTECGINRVAVRSTLIPGMVRITARRDGLKPGSIDIPTVPVAMEGGLLRDAPPGLPPYFTAPTGQRIAPVAIATAGAAKTAASGRLPTPFSFRTVSRAALFSYTVSEALVIAGLDAPTAIRIVDHDEEASFSINDGPFQDSEGVVSNGDRVRVRLGAGSQRGATYFMKLAIGGQTGEFRLGTEP